ncbi:MAG: peptidase T [Negativibacillus sp.]|nr:peptidase T [Negativibacillus sp.]
MRAYERLLHYVSFGTQSDHTSDTVPTTPSQKILGAALVVEMKALGIEDAFMDEMGYVYGTIPATKGMENKPVLGMIAHMDTAEDAPGDNIKAKVVEYNGGDILLNEEKQIYLTEKEYPSIKKYVGQHLVVTDGTTLLGADDKAGVAEIMTMAETLMNDPTIEHGTIKIGFTPDEEVGRGADHFDVERFGASFAYTVDGGELGELEYENFNAGSARLVVNGLSIHPGSAKNAMLNASLLAMEFHSMLPVEQNPRYTEGYEGFYHLGEMKGHVEQAELDYIIRDHDAQKYEQKKQVMQDVADYLNHKYGKGTFELTITESYRNMKEMVEPHMHLIDNAKEAFAQCGVEAQTVPIRGGTDGARLSYMGLPCPNLSTGGHNFHGRFEYIPVEAMDKMAEVLVHIVKIYAK